MATQSARWSRVLALLGSSCAGVVVGIAADYHAGDVTISAERIAAGITLAPKVVTCGGDATTVGGPAFFYGGLLFWPVYALLAWALVSKGRMWMSVLVFLWCSQGFFQLLHRLERIMSV
jgi:hypothetical protein